MQTFQFADRYQQQMIMLEKSLTQSVLSAQLIQNYLDAIYQANSHFGKLTLRIGKYCDILSRLMIAAKLSNALFITAYNPYGQLQSIQNNDLAQIELRKQLKQYSTSVYPGESIDPRNNWPAESSYLTLGIDLPHSIRLGIQFKQNAIVWGGDDAVPRLILLR
ncbi:MAG: DUF3293 domain-containing protein [Nitrosomonas sp.]|jgi:hypothetical protein|nr:DUF3293 domain-containing protein [Nitrosomonas sp.]MBK7365779.1 DUF3293 domain-containing protein [Nitrosomonas sp.]